MNDATKGNVPEKKFAAGGISATVWLNSGMVNGERREFRTVSFQRSYKDRDGAWRTSNSLRVNDIPEAQVVLGKAFEYVLLRETGLGSAADAAEEVEYT